MKQTITLTFSEAVENHKGMQIIGDAVQNGFQNSFIRQLCHQFGGEYIDLVENWFDEDKSEVGEVGIVVFRNGLKKIFGIDPNELYKEQEDLPVDKKAFMYGKVVNKHARYNLCFADFDQDPEYENKKGTVINFNDSRIKLTQRLRQRLGETFGSEFKNLYAEGNYYYNPKKCFIGFHGDSERKKVVGVRLGEKFDLHYQWFREGTSISERITIPLEGGDVYIMDEKATGNDWKRKKIFTLRHAAGDV